MAGPASNGGHRPSPPSLRVAASTQALRRIAEAVDVHGNAALFGNSPA